MNILVILATYNGEEYIRHQIMSILAQELVNVEILVCDDCSSDQTLDIVKSLHEDRIRLRQNIETSGSAANNFLNAILSLSDAEIAHYDYISLSDQDDIWLPNKLYTAASTLKETTSDLYASNLILWNTNNNTKSVLKKNYPQKAFDYLFEGASAGCTYVFSNSFSRGLRTQLLSIAYQDRRFFSHDWFIYFFARVNNYSVHIDEEAFIYYRIHKNNVHGQLSIRKKISLIRQGWYIEQANNYSILLKTDSIESKIYDCYCKNWITRFYVLFRYNFNLMRSKKKYVLFMLCSLLFPIKRPIPNVR